MTSQRSRSGRSTVIRRKPNASLGKILTFSPSVKSPYSRVISSICAAEISLRFSPSDLRIFTKYSRASTSWTLPRRSGALRLVTTQK